MDEIEKEVFATTDARLANNRAALFQIKLWAITIASAIVAAMQFAQILNNGQVQWFAAIGFVCAVIAGLGGVVVTLSDKDEKSELALAAKALLEARVATRNADIEGRKAREAQEEALRLAVASDEIDELVVELVRSENLYQAMSVMRATIESAAISRSADIKQNLTDMLEVAARPLTSAAGFQTEDIWTICVYRAVDTAAGKSLVLEADSRAIKCKPGRARAWPIGKGPPGICLANAAEVIVPDMTSPELGSVFDLGALRRKHDRDTYLSVAAIPIIVGDGGGTGDEATQSPPWGVVVGTSDRSRHFANDDSPTWEAESMRALAAMCASMIVTSDVVALISLDKDTKDAALLLPNVQD